MAYYDTPMSELEAVNIVLKSAGFTEVASLVSADDDTNIAYQMLIENNRAVQSRGWHFNTELVQLALSGGNFNLDADVVRADVAYSDAAVKAVMRGQKMYDLEDNTFTWTKATLWVTVVKLLQWTSLPFHAKDYITATTAVQFQEHILGSQVQDQFLVRRAQMAWLEMQRAENNSYDPNMFDGSWSTARVLNRRNFNRGAYS